MKLYIGFILIYGINCLKYNINVTKEKEELFMKIDWAIVSIFVSVLSFIVAFYFYKWVKSLPAKNEKIEKVR